MKSLVLIYTLKMVFSMTKSNCLVMMLNENLLASQTLSINKCFIETIGHFIECLWMSHIKWIIVKQDMTLNNIFSVVNWF